VLLAGPGLGAALGDELAARGFPVTTVTVGERYELGAGSGTVDPTRPEHLHRLVAELRQRHPDAGEHWLHGWSLEARGGDPPSEADTRDANSLGFVSLLQLVQALAAGDADPPARLTVLTRGAHLVTGRESGISVLQAPVTGLARVLAFEHPDLRCLRVDLDPDLGDGDPAQAARVVAQMLRGEEAEEIALRAGQAYVSRLRRLTLADPGAAEPLARPDGSYLITGGTGGLGLAAAGWLAGEGAGQLLLLSRRPPDPEASQRIEELGRADTQIRLVRGDVSSEADLRALLEEHVTEQRPLRGVIHTAGALDDDLITRIDRARFEHVFAPKALGGLHLHRLTLEQPLEHFVLFSSGASMVGHAGQASYAAANAFLDALATHRALTGRPGLSINWGGWSDVGYAARAGLIRRYERFGLRPVSAAEGTACLRRLVISGVPQAAVFGGDWRRYADMVWLGNPPAFLEELLDPGDRAEAVEAELTR
jgi:NAD(P)-dependent dehydrogenase (short-subunit alcohol dehydrogenase family)